MRSTAELTLATQLEQAGIPFDREYRFDPERKWRADFHLGDMLSGRPFMRPILVEIDGGGFVTGRHSRGTGMAADSEKQSAAAILGYRVVRCVPAQVENGTCLAWIEAALGLEREKRVAS